MAAALLNEQTNDALLAQDLSRREQESHDAALARHLSFQSAGVDQGLTRMCEPTESSGLPGHSAMSMLYVACELAESEVDMLVDTGAQMSVITEPLAGQLGLLSNLDRTARGVASGVGQAQIIGRLWDVPVKLGHVEFALTFSVLQTQQPLLILGLDQMSRFKCLVDMERGCLVFGGSGGVEVPLTSSSHGNLFPVDSILIQVRRAITMLQRRDAFAAPTVLSTLKRLLSNIARSPAEPKYRRLGANNDRLQREVFAHPEAVELLRVVGFVSSSEGLVLPETAPLHPIHRLCATSGPLG